MELPKEPRAPLDRPHQRLIVRLVFPEMREAAFAALEPALKTMYSRTFELDSALVAPARWNFAQLYDWYRYLSNTAWSREGVISSDIDESQNGIVFGVATEDAARRVRGAMEAVGAPCGLVTVKVDPTTIVR